MVRGTRGSTKSAVPRPTAVAPARMNSAASGHAMVPPSPMIGTPAPRATWRCTSWTMRTAIGWMPGPLSPPRPRESRGLRVRTSMLMAVKVFTRVSPSAPPSTAAADSLTTSALGLTFTNIRARRTAGRTSARSARSATGSSPNCSPVAVFGQLTLSSMIGNAVSASNAAATRT